MKKYEYKIESFTISNGKMNEFEKKLNEVGSDGWKLKFVETENVMHFITKFCIFYREKSDVL